jgi:hypothetical protein
MTRFLRALLLAVVLPAAATEFGDRYPAGSIRERAQSEQALRDAEVEQARIERDAQARDAECHKGFLVNQCRERVRRDRLDAERELRRVRVEAHDLQRQLDAADAVRRRAKAAERAGAPPVPSAREPRPVQGPSPDEAARNRADYDRRQAERQKAQAADQARAAERAANAREYEEKQAEAARREQQQAEERRKNEERRAERRKRIEAQEAEREQVRRRAEEAAKAAAKP